MTNKNQLVIPNRSEEMRKNRSIKKPADVDLIKAEADDKKPFESEQKNNLDIKPAARRF